MPKLYVFAVCDKVILDARGTASLISLFNEVHAILQPGTDIPPNAVAPKEWAVYVSWEQEPADAGKEYEQILQIISPDGSVFQQLKFKFTFASDKTHQQNTGNVLGFPIGREGTYTVKMWLEHNNAIVCEPPTISLRVKYDRTESPSS